MKNIYVDIGKSGFFYVLFPTKFTTKKNPASEKLLKKLNAIFLS